MKGFLPDQIITKRKHGMGLPIAKWLKEDKDLNALLGETLFSHPVEILNYMRPDYLNDLKNAFYCEDAPYYGDNFWVFLVLALWLKSKI